MPCQKASRLERTYERLGALAVRPSHESGHHARSRGSHSVPAIVCVDEMGERAIACAFAIVFASTSALYAYASRGRVVGGADLVLDMITASEDESGDHAADNAGNADDADDADDAGNAGNAGNDGEEEDESDDDDPPCNICGEETTDAFLTALACHGECAQHPGAAQRDGWVQVEVGEEFADCCTYRELRHNVDFSLTAYGPAATVQFACGHRYHSRCVLDRMDRYWPNDRCIVPNCNAPIYKCEIVDYNAAGPHAPAAHQSESGSEDEEEEEDEEEDERSGSEGR